MIVGQRLAERIDASGLSYSEVARRVGVRQPTISRLVSGEQRSTGRLDRLARVVLTTPAYLTGEIDDPSPDATPPPITPSVQFVTMQVALPSEEALSRMFLGVLLASEGLSRDEVARELAKSLPSGLALLRGPLTYGDQDLGAAEPGSPAAQPIADRERRRA